MQAGGETPRKGQEDWAELPLCNQKPVQPSTFQVRQAGDPPGPGASGWPESPCQLSPQSLIVTKGLHEATRPQLSWTPVHRPHSRTPPPLCVLKLGRVMEMTGRGPCLGRGYRQPHITSVQQDKHLHRGGPEGRGTVRLSIP